MNNLNKMQWEDIVAELGENLNISYGKVEELLDLIVFSLRHSSRLPKRTVIDHLQTLAARDFSQVESLFQKARDGRAELETQRDKVQQQRSMKALCNSLRGVLRFYREFA